MEARPGQNRDNKIAPQVNFNPTAPNIMARCVFSSSPNNTFFSVLVIIISNMSYFVLIIWILFYSYHKLFFSCTSNYFSNVYRELFFHWAENYFSCYRDFIFWPKMHCGPCRWRGLVRVFDFLGDHFENFVSRGVLSKRMPRRNIVRLGKDTKEVFIFLTKSARSK